MASASIDLSPEPDLNPIYPTPQYITPLLSSNSGLTPAQKSQLVAHCLLRACQFGDHSLLSYLFSDPQAHPYIDLGIQDEDGLGLVSTTILGFGPESERDVEREECIRLLVSQGADPNQADYLGWTPMHHAALLSPPTLISYLLTHGCSPFSVTRRKLTPLDIITAHTVVPGREDVALLLEEAMREEGWTGGRMEERRRVFEDQAKRRSRKRQLRDSVQKILGFDRRWWGDDDDDAISWASEHEDEGLLDDRVYTPPLDFTSMLVFSPQALPYIFNSLITTFPPTIGNAEPANALYMLARFAALTCDHTWLEDLIIGATDAIEETFFSHPDDIACLIFWLYNTTVWLHLLRCDQSINEACELLGSFVLIEEVINSVFVFIIRFAERSIDGLLDAALLDYSSAPAELEAVQFESEWSFLRPFSNKKKAVAPTLIVPPRTPSSVSPSGLQPSSPPSATPSSSTGFHSFKQSISKAAARQSGVTTPLHSLFPEPASSPSAITTFLTALQILMTMSGINPALITQLWSQVFYWTASETFNRILTRKKYLCRSKAAHINLNLSVLSEWVDFVGLPVGVKSHFTPVRDLLYWIQSHSAITEFSELVVTIQQLKNLNPLQMRRAVRDYRYEVGEGRMTEECIQYLAQLQKDWERHRVKLGVEALRKEMDEREREREDSTAGDYPDASDVELDQSSSALAPGFTNNIDVLFDQEDKSAAWEPVKPAPALGELLDSRFMLPLLLPSNPRLLSATPSGPFDFDLSSDKGAPIPILEGLVSSNGSKRTSEDRNMFAYRCRSRKIRDVGVDTLQWVDGYKAAARFLRPVHLDEDDIERSETPRHREDMSEDNLEFMDRGLSPLTRIPSMRRTKSTVPTPSDTKGLSAA
ncbi:hypothetical protein PUNSTDRAFT_95756 [Punctularia strigosozonata HHB-11173 SS5]|uniref:uncharacterized protein n=1 Tax=Punctularia strigosozonata (strain HHB-11173) TaxID=741275 RepID=UPI0004418208|nr:uncharacterized protein PUNSTDRAFT_95756 [Punctularia strigosozonata HHB-11173 SS5]EIN14146.1 hypothetical protein PUNSTDRAFT_95756 [Punctularia strigosozonata HHB-11173 SS5]